VSAAEIVCLVLGLAVAAVVGTQVTLWARRQVRLAQALTRRGWVVVGCPFLTGPEIYPPASKTSAEIRQDIAEAFREVGVQ
jgi:hypothetical protein